MHLLTPAIICAVRPHGEHGAIVRALTPADGIQAGYVRGGRSRRLRPILLAGNLVQAEYRARTEDQLAQLSVELVASRAPLLGEALPAAAIEWTTGARRHRACPRASPIPACTRRWTACSPPIEASPSARSWAPSLVRYELLRARRARLRPRSVECAATGATEDLAFVSPKSGRAVSAGAGRAHIATACSRCRPCCSAPERPTGRTSSPGLRITGHFLARDVLIERQAEILAARERLLDRLKRVTVGREVEVSVFSESGYSPLPTLRGGPLLSGGRERASAPLRQPLLDRLGDPLRRMAVAEREGRPRHPGIFPRVGEQAGDGGDDPVGVGADQLEIAGRQRFGPLGDVAQHQHRPAERRRLFLQAAAVGQDQPALVHQPHHRLIVERLEQLDDGRPGERLLDRPRGPADWGGAAPPPAPAAPRTIRFSASQTASAGAP